jgi:ArsR family transcriptional regulator
LISINEYSAAFIDDCQYNDSMTPANNFFCCADSDPHSLEEDQAAVLSKVFSALADPVRLQIYACIAATDEICSCNLEGPVGKSQPTISHHTAKLASAGLIVGEKRGRWMWWRVVPGMAEAALNTIRAFTPSR